MPSLVAVLPKKFLAVVPKRTANCRERVYYLPVRRDRATFARKQGWAG